MVIAAVIVALLGLAAWRDVATRSIPDGISIAILALGLATRLFDGWEPILVSLVTSVILFICLLPLQARGLLGGADLKLLSALAFGLSPLATWHLVLVVTVCGAVLAAVYLALRLALARRTAPHAPRGRARSLARRVAAAEAWRIRRRAPLPYGLAIAVGTIVSLAQGGV